MDEEKECDMLAQEIVDEEITRLFGQLSDEERANLLDLFLKYIVL